MVRRDFVAVYKQTILGPLWFIIQPLFTIVIYTVVFGKIAGISTEGLPRPVFYMAGITVWNYFADCLMKSSGVFRDNAGVFGKVYFPRLVVPFSAVISNMVRFAIQMLLFIGFIFYYYLNGMALHVNVYALLFPFLVLLIALLGMGSGMIISALTTKYRDLSFLVSFSMQLLMYATTVIYPLSAAPDNYKWVIMINPVTAIIETFRYGFLGSGSFSWALLAYASAFTFIILFVGIVVFTKVEKNFIDTV
ncbi:MAG: ABC transporter permease [Bacteroidetes bacterium]|nr:ABC transporter permease [Bacteroidota bacterium]